MKRVIRFIPVIFVALLGVISIFPLFSPGFFPFHDDTQVARVFEMWNSLNAGSFPVRWVEHLGYGFGYPIFNFYGPLSYYLGALFMFLGADALGATKIIFGIAMIGSGISMYFLAKELFGKISGVVASVVYIFFPYHAVNMYVRGALNELTAYVFLPLIFLGLIKIFKIIQKKHKVSDLFPWVILFIFSLSLTAIAHNLTFFMVCIFLLVFSSGLFIATKNKKEFVAIVGVVGFFSFLISSFYILPMALESQYTNVDSQIGGGANYSDHFVCLSQLWNSNWGFGGSTPTCLDGMSFKLGKTNILFGLTAILLFSYLLKKKKKDIQSLFLLLIISSSILSIFLMTGYSAFLWSSLPFMEYLQYPWRFLNFTGLFLSLLISFIIFFAEKMYSNRVVTLFCALGIIGFTLVFNAKLFRPQLIENKTASDYTNREELTWRVSKISDEYMPEGFSKPQSLEEVRKEKLEIVEGKGLVEEIYSLPTFIQARIILREKSLIRFNSAYFPGWEIYENNKKIGGVSIQDDGMYISLPEGEYTLTARLKSTPIQMVSNFMTIVGIISLFLGIITFELIQKYGKKTS